MRWIVPKEPGALTEDDIVEFCRARIARFKIPQYIRFVDEFPMTVKIQKFRMREIECAERGLVEAATT